MGHQVSCCRGQKDTLGALMEAAKAGTLENDNASDVWYNNFDNEVKWETDADGNKISLLIIGSASETEEHMLKFPMYGISMETLMQLDVMKTHEDLKRQNLLRKIPQNCCCSLCISPVDW